MLRPERDKIRSGFHKCLGSRRSMLRPERDKTRFGFHKCLGFKRPMSCPTLIILLTTCRKKKTFNF